MRSTWVPCYNSLCHKRLMNVLTTIPNGCKGTVNGKFSRVPDVTATFGRSCHRRPLRLRRCTALSKLKTREPLAERQFYAASALTAREDTGDAASESRLAPGHTASGTSGVARDPHIFNLTKRLDDAGPKLVFFIAAIPLQRPPY